MNASPSNPWRPSRVVRLWLVVGLAALALILPATLLPMLADREKAFGIRVEQALTEPSPEHWFGTDASGRSLWHRTLLGAGLSFRIVAGALVLALPLSLVLGTIAGLSTGRWPDRLITWVISLIYTVPFFLLVVSASAIVSPGLGSLPWIIGGVIWAAPARIVRSEAQRLASSPFLRQERSMGIGYFSTLFRSVIPMLIAPAGVSLLYLVPEIIGIDAVLGLFGLGANPPEATLGTLIYDGLKRWDSAPWLSGLPALFLLLFAIIIHHLADRLARQLRSTN